MLTLRVSQLKANRTNRVNVSSTDCCNHPILLRARSVDGLNNYIREPIQQLYLFGTETDFLSRTSVQVFTSNAKLVIN